MEEIEGIEMASVAKGSLWSLIGQLAAKFFGFLYTVAIARLFIQEEIGIFYFALGIISIISVFTDLGMTQVLARYVPYFYGKEEFGRLRKFIKFSLFLGGGLSFIFSLLIFFSAGFLAAALEKPELKPLLEILSITIFINELIGMSGGILLGRKKMLEVQACYILQAVAKLTLTVALAIFIIANNRIMSVAFVLSTILLLLTFGLFSWIEVRKWQRGAEDKTSYYTIGREIISFGVIISIITGFSVLATSTDRIMIGLLGGKNAYVDVGIYSVITTLTTLLLIFPTSITQIFFPVVSELFGKGKNEEIKKITAVATKWLVFITSPLTLIFLVFPDTLIRIFYGEQYTSGWLVFILFVIGLFIYSLSLLPSRVIAAMRRLDIELMIAALAAVANIILNFVFIMLYGMNGAAFATMISFTVMTLLTFKFSKDLFNFNLPSDIHKPLTAGVIALVILFLSRQYVLAQVGRLSEMPLVLFDGYGMLFLKLAIFTILFIIASGVYVMLLIFSKSFSKPEFEILRKAFRKLKIPEKYAVAIMGVLGYNE